MISSDHIDFLRQEMNNCRVPANIQLGVLTGVKDGTFELIMRNGRIRLKMGQSRYFFQSGIIVRED
jgi:hypothetical protein